MNRTADLVYWIVERYSIKLRREAGLPAKDWTADPIMQNVRWCNVHREDDKVTKWLAVNWRPEHHAVWEIVLARMVNYIPSLSELLFLSTFNVIKLDQVKSDLKGRRARGEKVFTSAYTISTCGKPMDKIDYVVDWVVKAVKDLEEGRTLDFYTRHSMNMCATAHQWMLQVDGLGSFLAAQVVADLKNTEGHSLQKAPDWWTWSAPGPGSLRGLSWYFGYSVTASAYEDHIQRAWGEVKPLLPAYIPPIHMQDFQNCLCEFSKYMKVREENGHVRNRYHAV